MHSKQERLTAGFTLLESERLMEEALHEGRPIETVIGTADFWTRRPDLIHSLAAAGIATSIASPKQMAWLSVTEQPGGILAVVPRPVWRAEEIWEKAGQADFMGVLGVGLQDPGNLGTLVRTLAAAGGTCMWLSSNCVELSSPKTLRASAGAVFRLPVIEDEDPAGVLARCQRLGMQTLAAVPGSGRPYTTSDLTGSTLLVLGGEGGGLGPEIIRACGQAVQIPMPGGMESLNVAVAGSIMVYEALRQRRLALARKREDKK